MAINREKSDTSKTVAQQLKKNKTMKTEKMIESWKSAKMSSLIGKSSINKEMMTEIQGGIGIGHIKTISGDCNSTGKSCWGTIKETIDKLLEAVI